MSELTTLYGSIEGAFGSTDDWHGLYSKNKEAIDSLPETDDWPPLTRNIFTVPKEPTNANKNPGFYRIQMIHFAASFNNFGDVWDTWLDKFENLLKQLYWHKSHLHLSIETYGRYDYHWEVRTEDIHKFYLKPPVSVAKWDFSGGPRNF